MADAKRLSTDRTALLKSFVATLELMRVRTSRASLGESESAQEFRDFLDLCWLSAVRLQEDVNGAQPRDGKNDELRHVA